MPYATGVDLGTTYSAAAIAGPDGVEAVDLGDRTSVVPSVIAINEDGGIVTGTAAERRLVLQPSRSAREFKRRLGDPTPLLLGGVPFGAETLTGHLLSFIVGLVAERRGEPPAVVGLSHPANYGNYKLGLLEEAARVAEISVVTFVPEPVAAAVHYAQTERVAEDGLIAVYDLGGGTFDATVVRRTGDGFEVIGAPDGMERFGGIDMDEAVLGHVRSVLGDEAITAGSDDTAAVSALAKLREECRSAKEALSGDTEVTIPVMLPGLHTDVRLTRTEFEDMIRPRIRETLRVLERTVASAGIETGDLNRVLLVGGSSRIPLVGEMIRHATGRPVALDAHPKLTIALGAARAARDSLAVPQTTRPAPPAAPLPPAPEPPERGPQPEPAPSAPEPQPEPAPRVPEPQTEPSVIRRRHLRPSGRVWRIAVGTLILVLALLAAFTLTGRQGDERPETTRDTAPEAMTPSTTPGLAAGATEVLFEADHTSSGLELMAAGDGDVEIVAAGQPQEQAWMSGNGRALPATDENTVRDWYMQFNVDDGFVYEGSPSSKVRIQIEYLDQGADQFRIEYDSNDGSIADSGRYKESEIVTKADSGEFRTAIFDLSDAYLGNRTNGGDFRLNDLSDGAEIVRRVTVSLS